MHAAARERVGERTDEGEVAFAWLGQRRVGRPLTAEVQQQSNLSSVPAHSST